MRHGERARPFQGGYGGVRAAAVVLLGAWLAIAGATPTAAGTPPGPARLGDDLDDGPGPQDSVGALKSRIAAVQARLDDLQSAADQAILDYHGELDRLDEAEKAYDSARSKAANAGERREAARRDAARYAASAYMGADLSMATAWVSPDGPQEVADRSGYLRLLADRRNDVVDRATASSTAADAIEEHAAQTRDKQREAADAAAAAKDRALAAVREQEESMESILAEQTELENRLASVSDDAGQERKRRAALQQARDAAEGSSTDAGCDGTAAAGYANGQIPEWALCPLPQPGERLRADAAVAFIELDGAFRERFGRPMCVTDSYRPLAEQVALFHQMQAGMAARPGTSTHGLGLAVDLCGGVNVHGSVEYDWMMSVAPDYGWHNPAWAQNGFEPWHWEYLP
ncbi:D-alanyl-D-alanine carboxypeptidase family protein [Marinactinospora thermotolerans]|uniref:D-alanyl-D-alanine carboxypeptidase family protein n=1 Tax=Marinactinospora thermotolerans TaxID=531310 RepID=UPI003D920D6D